MSRAFAEQGPLKLVISSFSPSVGGEGRQHLRVGVENGPPGSERGVKFHFFTLFGCGTAIQTDGLFLCTQKKAREHI